MGGHLWVSLLSLRATLRPNCKTWHAVRKGPHITCITLRTDLGHCIGSRALSVNLYMAHAMFAGYSLWFAVSFLLLRTVESAQIFERSFSTQYGSDSREKQAYLNISMLVVEKQFFFTFWNFGLWKSSWLPPNRVCRNGPGMRHRHQQYAEWLRRLLGDPTVSIAKPNPHHLKSFFAKTRLTSCLSDRLRGLGAWCGIIYGPF